MTLKKSKLFVRFMTTMLLGLLVSGCGTSSVGGNSPIGASSSNGKSLPILTIDRNADSVTMDPIISQSNQDIWVFMNIYEQLVKVNPAGNKIVPDLATSWQETKNHLQYTFHLRHGVKFSNGMSMTSADVKFSIQRAMSKKSLWRWTLKAIKNIQTPNKYTVVINLKKPWAPFLADVALFDVSVLPEKYFNKVGAEYF